VLAVKGDMKKVL